MKLLFLEWNSYCNEDMKEAFREMGHQVELCPFPKGIKTTQKEADEVLLKELEKEKYDFVFSFNYFPVVSNCCQEQGTNYLSWVYDSPYIHIYSYTVLNSCNYIFVFDYAVYEELKEAGIPTVYYLPLAVNEKRLGNLSKQSILNEKYQADISFVGSLYSELKNQLYRKLENVSPYVRGYLDGIVQAQKNIYGRNFLQSMLTKDIVEEIEKIYPSDPNAKTVMSPEAIYADYILARHVTALERREILELLGQNRDKYKTYLYTGNPKIMIPGIANWGPVDYYDEMPYVFRNSKINLNITLKGIKTGIPLRVFDIMGCGGFLLTNYQTELSEYFVEYEDFVCYNNYEDLLSKADYYMTHQKERMEIAENGARKVRTEHTMKKRIDEMIGVMKQGG